MDSTWPFGRIYGRGTVGSGVWGDAMTEDILERANAILEDPDPTCGWTGTMIDLIAEVERLRSLNESLMENGNDLRTRCQKAETRIKELEATKERLRSIEAQQLIALESTASIVEHQAARIKELEALNELNHKNMRSWLDTTTDKEFLDNLSSEIGFKDAYIKRLEAAFLKARQCPTCKGEGTIHPIGQPIDSICPKCLGDPESMAREALERIKEEREG